MSNIWRYWRKNKCTFVICRVKYILIFCKTRTFSWRNGKYFWLQVSQMAHDYWSQKSTCKYSAIHKYHSSLDVLHFFNFFYFILRLPYKRCLIISPSQKIFWFCSKFDHKLLGPYISLVLAVLSSAASRTWSCSRSLCRNL